MKKELHHLEDFLNDDDFREWVLEGKSGRLHLYWLRWLETHPDKASPFHQAVKVLESLKDESVPWDQDRKSRTLRHIQAGIRKTQSTGDKYVSLYPRQKKRPYHRYKIAASLAILFAFTLTFWWLRTANRSAQQEGAANDWVTQTNLRNQFSEIQLPDGSTVTLHRDSELKYDRSGFGRGHRNVYLTGEAFFEVQKNPEQPFRVHSGEFTTTALGTSFNVRAYADLPIKIQLATGKVKVYSDGESQQSGEEIILSPGQEAALGKDQQLHVRQIAIGKIAAWKKGVLVFDKTPFEEAVKILERWYGVEIDVKGPADRQPVINGKFDNEELDKTLASMQFALDFSYSINDQHIKIEFNR